MGRWNQGNKPTRAERKAEKAAAKEAAKEAKFEERELAKEEKHAAKAARSRWGRKRRDAEAEANEFGQGPVGFDHSGPAAGFGTYAPAESPAEFLEDNPDELLLEENMREIPVSSQRLTDRPPFGNPPQQMTREPDDILSGMRATPELEPEPEPQRRRSLGMRIMRKGARTEASPISRSDPRSDALDPRPSEQGTQIRPLHGGDVSTGSDSTRPPEESFANLRRVVDSPGAGASQSAHAPDRMDPDNVFVLDDPLVEPGVASSQTIPAGERHVEPLRLEPENRLAPPASGLSENWLGLWVSEEGAAIFIEEDGDGWFAVTVLPDPTTTCYSGPDYPEIQSYRMPASYAREELGEFDGERLSVITVPGLPDTHRSPMMYIYFLTSIPAAQGGGSRFATLDDPTRRVFIAADFESGTVNPWSDNDDIEWVDPSVNYYKAPGKLDAYMMRRMAKDDPLN